MRRNKYRDYLCLAATAVFFACLFEGFLYYQDVDSTLLKFTLNLQNIIKAYKIDPDIKQEEAMNYLLTSGGGIIATIITDLYCIGVVVAPICTLGALAALVCMPLSYVRGRFRLFQKRKEQKILVWGNGEYQTKFVDALAKNNNVFAVEENSISDEKRLSYLNRGIRFAIKYSDTNEHKFMKSLKCARFEDILLCDENSFNNFLVLRQIMEDSAADTAHNPVHIHVCCSDITIGDQIKEFCDKQRKGRFLVDILDVNQLAVNKMFLDHPIYTANQELIKRSGESTTNNSYDVHIGICGLGDFGQRTLLQALNMSVLSADSKICIDAFDRDMKNIIGTFMKHFSEDVLCDMKHSFEEMFLGEAVECYSLSFPTANADSFGMDGIVELRFWNVDVFSLLFNRVFKRCNAIFPFTYLVLAMKDALSISNAISDIRRIIQEEAAERRIPIIIREKDHRSSVRFETLKSGMDTIDVITQDEDIFSFAGISNQQISNLAKQFNYQYNAFSNMIAEYNSSNENNGSIFHYVQKMLPKNLRNEDVESGEINEMWAEMSLFDRESSVAQAMHQSVKVWLVKGIKVYSLHNDQEYLEKLEHRRWVLFMISRGYKYSNTSKKDTVLKTHSCILDWEKLKIERPDTLVYDFTPYCMIKE